MACTGPCTRILVVLRPFAERTGDEATTLTAANDLAIRHRFEAAGIDFIEENGAGPATTRLA